MKTFKELFEEQNPGEDKTDAFNLFFWGIYAKDMPFWDHLTADVVDDDYNFDGILKYHIVIKHKPTNRYFQYIHLSKDRKIVKEFQFEDVIEVEPKRITTIEYVPIT